MSNRAGGRVVLNIDGRAYNLTGTVSFKPGGIVNSPIPGGVGFTTERTNPFVEVTAITFSDVDLYAFDEMTDVTAYVELANGNSHVMTGAYPVESPTTDPTSGEAPIRFECDYGNCKPVNVGA